MKVLLDADMPAHEIGHIRVNTKEEDEDGNPITELLSLEEMLPVAKGTFMSIIINAEAGGFKSYLTRGRSQWRNKIATIRRYKGNRENAPRDNVDAIKDYFHKTFASEWCNTYEADDAMAMDQWFDLQESAGKAAYGLPPEKWDWGKVQQKATTVIASRDKDLDTVPGWRYKWFVSRTKKKHDGSELDDEERKVEKGEVYWVSWPEACRNFYTQLLMGDTADNIHGLHRVGEKSAWVKQLQDMEDEEEMYDHVADKYEKYYRQHWYTWLLENGRLLWMWRRLNDRWLPPAERNEDYWK